MTVPRTLVVFHLAETSGPFRDLELDLDWLAEAGALEIVVPGPGPVADAFRPLAPVTELAYSALTWPRRPLELGRGLREAVREVGAFRSRMRESRPQLVVVGTATLPAALIAARLERVPALVYATELLGGEGGPVHRRGAGALIGLTRRLAAAIVACSEAAAHQFGDRGAPVTIAYPPIPDAYGGGDGASFRRAHGIAPSDRCVIVVGNLTQGRGQDLLVRALPAIRRAFPATHCAIIGAPFPRAQDLAFADRLQRLTRELDIASSVTLTGFVDEIADAYAAADIVVNPARAPESFGRAACEALVAGCPVVATRVGAVPEVLRDRETAVLVPPVSPEALAAAIVGLLEDPSRAERIAAAGRRDVLRRFGPERSREAFRRAIDRIVAD
jgi:glycosyltransferase involved in cell wall biosynthesis